jgi:hypothetical protein
MIALGGFALAAPKKNKIKEWCIAIRWVDGKGLKRSTVFEFFGIQSGRGSHNFQWAELAGRGSEDIPMSRRID